MRALVLVLVSTPALAQVWNSNAGGWNTGYGTVYGSFGLAMATQNMYNTTQLNLQRAISRQAMINKWGLAAVEKAEREARAGRAAPTSTEGPVVTAPPPAPKNLGRFTPSKSSAAARQLSEALSKSPEERAMLSALVTATKQAFESQPETQTWKNNVAGALTFFLVGNLTIAQGLEEPSDEVTQALFVAVSQTVDETPELAKASNKDKQQLYDLLIGFTGIPIAILADAQERHDAEQEKQAREIAANLIRLVLKVEPSQIKLTP